MYKANHVIGLPVIDLHEGQKLGMVSDVLFDKSWEFKGLLVEIKAFFRRGRYLPSDSIYAIGEDCVTIPREEDMIPIQEAEQLNGLYFGPVHLRGKTVITANGHRMGQLEDLYFDFQQEVATITGFELSDGLLSDIMDGRRVLRKVDNITIGEDAVVIPVSSEGDWQEMEVLTETKGEV